MTLVLKNGHVFYNDRLQQLDILIEGKTIKKISSELNGDRIIDVSEKMVIPGLIDAHVHFRDPGATNKEDFHTGSMAAAAGGVTTVLDMPNTNPAVTRQQDVDEKIRIAAEKSLVNYGIYVAATPHNIETLNKISNVCAVKAFLGATTGNILLDNPSDFARLMETAERLVVVHAENEPLLRHYARLYGTTKLHHKIRPNLAAYMATVMAVSTAQYYRKRLHIAHVSTKEEIDFLRKKKDESITCEACPHHLFLNSNFFTSKGNFGKMNPPLRSDRDVQALWDGIKEGIIDMISTDHAPHTIDEKAQEYDKAPAGVPGVQDRLTLLLNEVNKGVLELADLVRLCCTNPAKIFNIKKRGELKEGNYADIVVVDMKKESRILNSKALSKCKWTPYHNTKTKGWPFMTIVNGRIVFENGKIVDEHPNGVIVN
ncbi:dihydroorotase [Candidatus Woesearchaeota archaeon]|nr:dihydroorotase [Candidatus Woesearchaeota archaeon]